MRIRSLVLAVATALAIAAPATAAGPFSTGYLWAQPKVAITANPFAALPLWLTLKEAKPITLAQLPLLTSYRWAQPHTAPTHNVQAQPWKL